MRRAFCKQNGFPVVPAHFSGGTNQPENKGFFEKTFLPDYKPHGAVHIMTRAFPTQALTPAIRGLALTLALLAQWPAAAQGQGNPTMHCVTVLPGETVTQATRRALRDEGLARRGMAVRPPLPAGTPLDGTVAPTLIAGSIVSPSINVTVPIAAPVIQFTFRAPSLWDEVMFEFTSPHGRVLDLYYAPQYPSGRKGTATFQDIHGALGLYAEPGAWTLTYAIITASYGPFAVSTSYDQSQLAAIFANPTLTVVNPGEPDITPPTVSSGKILTPVVHVLKPNAYFSAQLNVADDVSGVNAVYLYVAQKQSGMKLSPQPGLPAPILKGSAEVSLQFNSLSLQGPYSILGYGAQDVAGNMFLDETDSDIKTTFGTTVFKVEN